MGFLREKYTRDYFLGAVDDATGEEYGVDGYEAFRNGGIDDRFRGHIDAVLQVMGDLHGKAILDIGCGRGDLEKLLVELGPARVEAVDFSPDALGIAEQFVTHPDVHFHLMEATDIAWQDCFDVVFMADVLEHIPSWEMDAVMSRVRLSLRPGGLVLICTPIFKQSDEEDRSDCVPSVAGMHCNKQTFASMLALLRHHRLTLIGRHHRRWIVKRAEDVGLVRRLLLALWYGAKATKRKIKALMRTDSTKSGSDERIA